MKSHCNQHLNQETEHQQQKIPSDPLFPVTAVDPKATAILTCPTVESVACSGILYKWNREVCALLYLQGESFMSYLVVSWRVNQESYDCSPPVPSLL